jgi:hypothetical protein
VIVRARLVPRRRRRAFPAPPIDAEDYERDPDEHRQDDKVRRSLRTMLRSEKIGRQDLPLTSVPLV